MVSCASTFFAVGDFVFFRKLFGRPTRGCAGEAAQTLDVVAGGLRIQCTLCGLHVSVLCGLHVSVASTSVTSPRQGSVSFWPPVEMCVQAVRRGT